MLTVLSVPDGGSLTAFTVRSKVSVAVRPLVAVTVTVIVVVPLWFAAGVICRLREPPEPVTLRLAFGTNVVFDYVAVTVAIKEPVSSPMLKETFLTVSSLVDWFAMSSIDGCNSNAPMSTT